MTKKQRGKIAVWVAYTIIWGGGSLVDKDLRKLAPNLERESTSVARLPRSGRWEETGSDWQ